METTIKTTFAERHPILNMLLGLVILVAGLWSIFLLLSIILSSIGEGIIYLVETVSKLDAVIIVALITGAISIIGVIVSSIIAKLLDYKKARQSYLAQKREQSYSDFVEMIYKLQQNTKGINEYTQKDMLKDLSKFSKQITLWGSKKVVNKWVEFRENSANPEMAKKNLLLMEAIMNQMRKDLGLKKVKQGNLLAFFVNDIKEAMKEMKK